MGDWTYKTTSDNTTIEPASLRIPSESGGEIDYSSDRDLMAKILDRKSTRLNSSH